MAHKLKIELRQSDPLIYRTVLIPEKFTFHELHTVIQLVMNWENTHLYQFNLGAPYVSDSIKLIDEEEEEFFDFGPEFEKYEATETHLSDFFNGQKKQLNYIYDFGDDWIHLIKVQKKPTEEVLFPICIKGENAAPVDDCGGVFGFYSMMEILNDPKNTQEKKELMEWLGLPKSAKYEDEYGFNLEDINVMLKEEFMLGQ
jgi:hypothetical protein